MKGKIRKRFEGDGKRETGVNFPQAALTFCESTQTVALQSNMAACPHEESRGRGNKLANQPRT